jgi:hypothetical protein
MLTDSIFEIELGLGGEHHDERREQLFANRPELEHRIRSHRHAVLQVCEAVTLQLEDFAVADDG